MHVDFFLGYFFAFFVSAARVRSYRFFFLAGFFYSGRGARPWHPPYCASCAVRAGRAVGLRSGAPLSPRFVFGSFVGERRGAV